VTGAPRDRAGSCSGFVDVLGRNPRQNRDSCPSRTSSASVTHDFVRDGAARDKAILPVQEAHEKLSCWRAFSGRNRAGTLIPLGFVMRDMRSKA
jgi:hypothetical protein